MKVYYGPLPKEMADAGRSFATIEEYRQHEENMQKEVTGPPRESRLAERHRREAAWAREAKWAAAAARAKHFPPRNWTPFPQNPKNLSQMQRTSIEHTTNTYRTYLSNIYRIYVSNLMRQHFDISDTYLSNISDWILMTC